MEGFIKRYPDVTLSKKYQKTYFWHLCNFTIVLPMGWLPSTHHHGAIRGTVARHLPWYYPLRLYCRNDDLYLLLASKGNCWTLVVEWNSPLEGRERSPRRPRRDQFGPLGDPGRKLGAWETLGGNWESSWETTLATGGRHTTCQRHTSYRIESRFHKPANFTIMYQIHFKVWGGQIFILAHIQF